MFWSIFISVLEVVSAVATLIFGVYGAINDTSLKDGKMTSKRRVALYGVLISGAITISIKTTQAVISYYEKEQEAYDLAKKNIKLKIESELEQRYKDSVTKKLDSSLGKLGVVVSDDQKSLASLNNIDTVQKRNTKAQEHVFFNTQRFLAPLRPITFTVSYIIDLASLPSQNKFIKDYYDRMLMLKDSLERDPTIGRPGFIISGLGSNRGQIKRFNINIRNYLFPKDGSDFIKFLHREFSLDLIQKEDNSIRLQETPGMHFTVFPPATKPAADELANNDIELDVHFSGKIIVRIISNTMRLIGTRNDIEKYYSTIDLADKYVFLTGEQLRYANLYFFSFHGSNGAITCLPVTEANRATGPFSATRYKRKVLKGELMKNDCNIDLPE